MFAKKFTGYEDSGIQAIDVDERQNLMEDTGVIQWIFIGPAKIFLGRIEKGREAIQVA